MLNACAPVSMGTNWSRPVARAMAIPRVAWRMASTSRSIRCSAHARRLSASMWGPRRLVVRLVQPLRGERDGGAGRVHVAGVGVRVRERGRAGADQQRVAQPLRDGQRLRAQRAPADDVEREEGARDLREQDRQGVLGVAVRQRRVGGVELPVGGVVAAEEVLGRGRGGDQPDPRAEVVVADEREGFAEALRARLEIAGRAQHLRQADQGAQARRRRPPRACRRRAASNQRAAAAGARGAVAAAASSSSCDRGRIARHRGLLDVPRPGDRRGAARRQRGGRARACAPIRQPPPVDA